MDHGWIPPEWYSSLRVPKSGSPWLSPRVVYGPFSAFETTSVSLVIRGLASELGGRSFSPFYWKPSFMLGFSTYIYSPLWPVTSWCWISSPFLYLIRLRAARWENYFGCELALFFTQKPFNPSRRPELCVGFEFCRFEGFHRVILMSCWSMWGIWLDRDWLRVELPGKWIYPLQETLKNQEIVLSYDAEK